MDKIELQRLLDGELDRAQRRRVLCKLDEQPNQWRTVALALLEEQEFQRELGPQTKTLVAPLDSRSASNAVVDSSLAKSDATNGSANRWLGLALAASLLIGLGFVGGNWLASQFENKTSPIAKVAGPTIATTESKPAMPLANESAERDFASLKPVGQLSFTSDTTSNASGNSIQVPMYEAAPEQLSQMLLSQQQQMQQWNDQLRRRGFELDWRPEMIESRLPDGRAVVVPIQQVHVRSLGQ